MRNRGIKNQRYCLLAGILACLTACTGGRESAADDDRPVESVLPEMISEVTVMKLTSTGFHHELVSNGKLSARQYADLRFESAEPVAFIHVKNGDRVSRGQPLAGLSTFRLSNKLKQAQDALDRSKLDLQDALIGQGFAPEDSTNVPPSTMQLVRTKSGYNQALAQYELALHEERNAVLTAPFDGVVANLFAKPFNMASPSDVFCTLIDPHSLEAVFSVLESELPLIKPGDRVVVTPFSMPGGSTEGHVSEINPLVDADGMVRVKATVDNPGRLFEGMNVRVSIRRLIGSQFVVPKSAVVLRSGKQVIFTLVDGKAKWMYAQTGLENADSYTVTAEGLQEGDTVITGGNINLAHESPVTVVEKFNDSKIQ
jgi:RND family efflux transporter MFP subunit